MLFLYNSATSARKEQIDNNNDQFLSFRISRHIPPVSEILG